MRNRTQPGKIITLVAPYAVVAGAGALVGSIFGVAVNDVANGASGSFALEGVFSLAKTSAQAWVQGDRIYWDNTNKRCDNVATLGPLIGFATAAAANPTATGSVELCAAPVDRAISVVTEGSPAPASYATAGPQTYTAADILGKVIVRDPAGANRTDTFPTAALLVAAVPGAKVGDMIDVLIVNGADAAESVTLAAGTGGGFDTNQTAASRVIAQNSSKLVKVRLTNVTASSEAYVIYA